MDFSFKKILGSINLSGGGKATSVIGVDIGSSSVKIVQLRLAHGAALLETYGEIALGPYGKQPIGKAVKLAPEVVSQAVTDLIREANVTARESGISIPFSASLITVLNLPKVDNEQLKQIVPIEARKYIPVPVSEVTLDWFVIPHDEATGGQFDDPTGGGAARGKGQDGLLAAIHNAVTKPYQALTTASNKTAQFYEIEIFSGI